MFIVSKGMICMSLFFNMYARFFWEDRTSKMRINKRIMITLNKVIIAQTGASIRAGSIEYGIADAPLALSTEVTGTELLSKCPFNRPCQIYNGVYGSYKQIIRVDHTG